MVFSLTPAGKEPVLHRFSGSGGGYPAGGLIIDRAGNLYGTTFGGGAYGYGIVLKLQQQRENSSVEDSKSRNSKMGLANGLAPVPSHISGTISARVNWVSLWYAETAPAL